MEIPLLPYVIFLHYVTSEHFEFIMGTWELNTNILESSGG